MKYNPFYDIVGMMPDTARPLTVADINSIATILAKANVNVNTYREVVDVLKYLAHNDAIHLAEQGELIIIEKKVYGKNDK